MKETNYMSLQKLCDLITGPSGGIFTKADGMHLCFHDEDSRFLGSLLLSSQTLSAGSLT
jgi:hypothetical protein